MAWQRGETVTQWGPLAIKACSNPLGDVVKDEILRAGSGVVLHFVAPPDGRSRPEAATGPIERVVATLRQWRQRARSRRELAGLDGYLLRDIGVSWSQAQFESGKRFWQA
ncbi:hypothetical protein GCM10027034_31340 [Ramlibacter solisilvae]